MPLAFERVFQSNPAFTGAASSLIRCSVTTDAIIKNKMKAKNMAIVRLLAVTIASLSSLAAPGAETNFFFARGAAGQFLRSVGVNTNGPTKEIWYAGEQNGVAALFQLVGTNFVSTNLAELVEGETYAYSISRDARTVVGISGFEAVLWNVSTPGTAQGLGIPAGRSCTRPSSVRRKRSG